MTRIEINAILIPTNSFGKLAILMELPPPPKKQSTNYAIEIINEAISQGVPVNLALAVVHSESEFNMLAFNENVRNGKVKSIDRGLFQLNSLSFPELRKEDFYNPMKNIRIGVSYLRFMYERFGNWEQACLAYNCGALNVANKTIPASTKKYLAKILKKEKELDEAFNNYYITTKFPDYYKSFIKPKSS